MYPVRGAVPPPQAPMPRVWMQRNEVEGVSGGGRGQGLHGDPRAPTSMAERVPYTMGLDKLDEGPTLTARISPGEKEICVGTRVVAEFKKEGDKTVLFFKPLGSTSP